MEVKTSVQLCWATLKWVDKVQDLGNHLEYNQHETKEVTMKKRYYKKSKNPPGYTCIKY